MTSRNKVKDIQSIILSKKLDGLFISNIKNVRYLTGFTGSSAFILITKDRGLFFTDFRYTEQAETEVKGWEIGIEKGKRINLLSNLIRKLAIKKLGFETSISYDLYVLLTKIKIIPMALKNPIENYRKVKKNSEIDEIKKAISRAEEAFLKIKPRIKIGVRERQIALELEERLKRAGCKAIPFDIIVTSGKNSSMPHAQPTDKKLGSGDFVIIDWGGEANGYYSDMTRTFLMVGERLAEKKRLYDIVNKAREEAIKSVREGIRANEIDCVARSIIKNAGFGDYFGHATGHGVGLEVHEEPRISWTNRERIAEGMVFTIEPGIYKPNLGGVRIEDMITLRKGDPMLLTTLSRKLEIIR
ncbi:MAG: M24 family metallopeptidase [Dissulfurispiraceae bacterium]